MSSHTSFARSTPRQGLARPWAVDGAATDYDILDFTVLWAPIGGPSDQHIHNAFGLASVDYKHRLDEAGTPLPRTTSGPTCPTGGPVYADSVLTTGMLYGFDRELREPDTTLTPTACPGHFFSNRRESIVFRHPPQPADSMRKSRREPVSENYVEKPLLRGVLDTC